VEIELRQLDSDPLVAAVISGDVEVGQLSLAGTAAGRSRGAEFLAFAGDDQPNPYYVVGRDPVDQLEEVRGEAFAATSNLTQITGQTAIACLDSVGIDIQEDVDLLQLENTGSVAEALRTGQVVAGLTAPHRMAPIIAEEGPDAYHILCIGADVAPQLNNVWMARESWVQENEDLALAFAIASVETGRWAHSERDEWTALALEVAPDYEQGAVESIYETYVEELDLWPVNGSLDRALCEATLQSSLESGAFEEPMSCDDVITFEFQEQALEILGTE
jgi:ABC-type nitrate/sulfonate/bicarbonate transport system substrate-binding protein